MLGRDFPLKALAAVHPAVTLVDRSSNTPATIAKSQQSSRTTVPAGEIFATAKLNGSAQTTLAAGRRHLLKCGWASRLGTVLKSRFLLYRSSFFSPGARAEGKART